MASAQPLKQRLLTEIEKLPENELGEVLDFVGFLLAKQQVATIKDAEQTADRDPLRSFIGGVAHGALAQRIDEELYGT
jgi:hypothetical protein